MPYPINTLPYPFKKRLRQLLTPVELLQLQMASGHLEEHHYLLPDQKNQKYNALTLEKMPDNRVSLRTSPFSIIRDLSIVFEAPIVWLRDFDENSLFLYFFYHLQIQKVKTLTLYNCILTEPFLAVLAQKKFRLTYLNINLANKTSEPQPRLPLFFKAFPTVLHISLSRYAYEGWVKDILDYKMFGLERFAITSYSFDKLFSFSPEEMYQFVKLQHYKFHLEIGYVTEKDYSTEVNRILPLFKQHFNLVHELSDHDVSFLIQPSFAHGTPPPPAMIVSYHYYFKLRPSVQCVFNQILSKFT